MWRSSPYVFDRACSYFSSQTALVAGGLRYSYAELGAWANRVANGLLESGVRRGDRVGLLMPNCAEFIPTQYGVWKSGAAVTQLPARASAGDLRFLLDKAAVSTLVYHWALEDAVAEMRGALPELKRVIRVRGAGDEKPNVMDYEAMLDSASPGPPDVAISPDDLAFVGFTSGTTGEPKGVLQTHETWSHYAITAGLEIADVRPGEVFAHGAPLTHYTQTFVLPTFMRGGTNVVLPGLDVDMLLDAIEQESVTATAVVPTIVYLLLDHPRLPSADLSSLRTIVYAGSPMAPDRLRRALELLGPVFVQCYAGTEPGYMTCLRKEDHRAASNGQYAHLASAGRAMYHVELTIRDADGSLLPAGKSGEICAAQPGQMISYIDAERNSEAIGDGWIRSGDIGYLDEDDYLFIIDRRKDMIVSGGFNVFPRQIEGVLASHPAVAQCAVIGVPDPKWGEAVKAVVVAREDVSTEELIALVKQHKGSVWAPKSVDFVDELPLNPSGKVDKRALRAPYWVGRSRLVN